MNLKEFYKPLWGFGFVLFGLIILANIVITGSLGKHPAAPDAGVQTVFSKPISIEIVQNSLSPDQPTRYDFIEHDEEDRPQDSGQWDYHIKKTFQEAGLESRLKEDNRYQSLATSHEDFQKRLAGVDSLIRTNKEKLAADPDNNVTRQQLNELKKLRSVILETEKYFVE